MISLKRVKLTMQKPHYKVAPTWQKMYGGRQGMGCNSENKYLLASRQSLFNQEHEKKPKWRFTLCSWLVLLERTPWWSPASKCFCRVRVCVNVSGCGIVLLLLLRLLCLFHGFFINESPSLCFLSLLVHSLWLICSGWFDFSSRNYTF